MTIAIPAPTDPGGLKPGERKECCRRCCKAVLVPKVVWKTRRVELCYNYPDVDSSSKPFCNAQCDVEKPGGGEKGVCHEFVGVQTTRKVVTRKDSVIVEYYYPAIEYVPSELCVDCGLNMEGCRHPEVRGRSAGYSPNAHLEPISPGPPQLQLESLRTP